VADDPGEVRVRRYWEAVNPGRFERLDDLLANEFVDHEELRGIPPTREGLTMYPVSTPGPQRPDRAGDPRRPEPGQGGGRPCQPPPNSVVFGVRREDTTLVPLVDWS
jgi:hypothetical protein